MKNRFSYLVLTIIMSCGNPSFQSSRKAQNVESNNNLSATKELGNANPTPNKEINVEETIGSVTNCEGSKAGCSNTNPTQQPVCVQGTFCGELNGIKKEYANSCDLVTSGATLVNNGSCPIVSPNCKSEKYCLQYGTSGKFFVERSSCDLPLISKGGYKNVDTQLCIESPLEYCLFNIKTLSKPTRHLLLKSELASFESSGYAVMAAEKCQENVEKRLVCIERQGVAIEAKLTLAEIDFYSKNINFRVRNMGECLPTVCTEEKICAADTTGKTQEINLNSCTKYVDLKEKNLTFLNNGACTSTCIQKRYCVKTASGTPYSSDLNVCTKDSFLASNGLSIVNEGNCTKQVCQNVADTNFVGDKLRVKMRASHVSDNMVKALNGQYPNYETKTLNDATQSTDYPGAYAAASTYAGGRGITAHEFIDRRNGGITYANLKTAILSHHEKAKSYLTGKDGANPYALFGFNASEITVLDSKDSDIDFIFWDSAGNLNIFNLTADTRGQGLIWHNLRYLYKGVEFQLHLLYTGAWFNDQGYSSELYNWDNEMIAWFWEKPKVKQMCITVTY